MKSIENYLDELKSKLGSDYQISLALGVDRSAITHMRKTKGFKDENALKIAELLEIDPAEVLLAAAMARSHGAVREAWVNVSKRAGIAATLALVAVLNSGFSNRVEAGYSDNGIYIMRSARRIRAWLKRREIFTISAGIVAV